MIWKEFTCERCYNIDIKCMNTKPMCEVCGHFNGYYKRMIVSGWVE